jgi:hypothetical protein
MWLCSENPNIASAYEFKFYTMDGIISELDVLFQKIAESA